MFIEMISRGGSKQNYRIVNSLSAFVELQVGNFTKDLEYLHNTLIILNQNTWPRYPPFWKTLKYVITVKCLCLSDVITWCPVIRACLDRNWYVCQIIKRFFLYAIFLNHIKHLNTRWYKYLDKLQWNSSHWAWKAFLVVISALITLLLKWETWFKIHQLILMIYVNFYNWYTHTRAFVSLCCPNYQDNTSNDCGQSQSAK